MNASAHAGTSDPTVQTPSGPPAASTGTWDVSLSEIDAMCRKAARGAGHDWGLAEEAGRAARALAAWRLPGPEALLAALRVVDGTPRRYAPCTGDTGTPTRRETAASEARWAAPAGPLCPIATGAALSDRAGRLRAGAVVTLGEVLSPVLLMPFLCRAARDLGCRFRLDAPGYTLLATGDGPYPGEASLPSRLDALRVSRDAGAPGASPASATAAPSGFRSIDVATWRALDRFALRTCVPASEASRAGAGAGTRDDD